MRFNAPTTTLRGGFAAPITGIAPRRDLAPDKHRPSALMNDVSLSKIPAGERKIVRDAILDEVRGRMLEDIVLLETIKTKADGPVSVFKLQFAAGEYDMVVADSDALTCALYEVKHTTTPQLWPFPHSHISIIPHSHIFSPPTLPPRNIQPPRLRRVPQPL